MTVTDQDLAQIAASDWQAWPGRIEDDECVPTSAAFGKGPGVQLRMCVMVMHKSKAELVQIVRDMWDAEAIEEGHENLFDGFFEHIVTAKAFAGAMLQLATSAEARCLAAAAAVAIEEEAP